MTSTAAPVPAVLLRRFKIAGLLVALGLIVESLTLFWTHPTAFLVFVGGGWLLVAAGVVLYLFSLASVPPGT